MLTKPTKPNRINRDPLMVKTSFKICVTHSSDEGNIKKGMADIIATLLLTPSFSIIATILIAPIA